MKPTPSPKQKKPLREYFLNNSWSFLDPETSTVYYWQTGAEMLNYLCALLPMTQEEFFVMWEGTHKPRKNRRAQRTFKEWYASTVVAIREYEKYKEENDRDEHTSDTQEHVLEEQQEPTDL